MLRLYQARRSLNGRQGFAAGVPGSRHVDRKFTQQRQYLEQLVGRCSRAFPPGEHSRRRKRFRAEVAELADAHGSGPCTRKGVGARVPSSAPSLYCILLRLFFRIADNSPDMRDMAIYRKLSWRGPPGSALM